MDSQGTHPIRHLHPEDSFEMFLAELMLWIFFGISYSNFDFQIQQRLFLSRNMKNFYLFFRSSN